MRNGQTLYINDHNKQISLDPPLASVNYDMTIIADKLPMTKAPSGQGSGFRVQGSGFRVQGSGFKVQGSGIGQYLDVCINMLGRFDLPVFGRSIP